jgi:hypothetical protein
MEAVEAMRNDHHAREGIKRLEGLCTEATAGSFHVVAESPWQSAQTSGFQHDEEAMHHPNKSFHPTRANRLQRVACGEFRRWARGTA